MKRWLLKRKPFLADVPEKMKKMVEIWLLRRLRTRYFQETAIMIGEAGGYNLSIWEKIVLRTAKLNSIEDIFTEEQFLTYIENRVHIGSLVDKSTQQEQQAEGKTAQDEQRVEVKSAKEKLITETSSPPTTVEETVSTQ